MSDSFWKNTVANRDAHIAHLESHIGEQRQKLAELEAQSEEDQRVNAMLHDELRAKKIDVNSAALEKANLEIRRLRAVLAGAADVAHDPNAYLEPMAELRGLLAPFRLKGESDD